MYSPQAVDCRVFRNILYKFLASCGEFFFNSFVVCRIIKESATLLNGSAHSLNELEGIGYLSLVAL